MRCPASQYPCGFQGSAFIYSVLLERFSLLKLFNEMLLATANCNAIANAFK